MIPALPYILKSSKILTFMKEDLDEFPFLKENIRYYVIQHIVGEGAYSVAYCGYPCNNSGVPLVNAPRLVIKIPIIGEKYTEDITTERMAWMRRHSRIELNHIRRRLSGCVHANSIIDLIEMDDNFDLLATVQLYLEDKSSLKSWLENNGFIVKEPQVGITTPGRWLKYLNRNEWVGLSLQIALAVRDVHRHRVTHGDIHPGNIFISNYAPHKAQLIDFGESFVATPTKAWRLRRAGIPYLAPERIGSPIHLNEQVDVYSLGILLLYLASGRAECIPPAGHLRPGDRRGFIKKIVQECNSLLIRHEPRIIDIIALSTAWDPVDRPRMSDLVDDLTAIATATPTPGISPTLDISRTLHDIAEQLTLKSVSHSPLLIRLLEREVRDLAQTVEALETEMVELDGTRKQLLRALISVFEDLKEGDSWTTVTTPSVWQNSALGLGGSYNSATIRALLRGASVRRAYIVSVEELGMHFCGFAADKFLSSGDSVLQSLGKQLEEAMARYACSDALSRINDKNYRQPSPAFIQEHRDRFVRVISSLHEMVAEEGVYDTIHGSAKFDIHSTQGLFLGLHFTDTLDSLGGIRADNPASLIHISGEVDELKQWILVVTEIRGRSEDTQNVVRPQLHGLRIFQSVMGKPTDRIKYLAKFITESVIDIRGKTESLKHIFTDCQNNADAFKDA